MGELRIHGRGGQGTVIAAEMLANAFVFGGKYASVFPSFGVERRGSAVVAFARFGDEPIREHTRVYRPDMLLMLDQSLTENPTFYNGFKPGGLIVANTKNPEGILGLDVKPGMLAAIDGVSVALEETGTAITNTCMLGAFAKATGLVELEDLKKALAIYFKGKVLEKNLRSLERGFNEVAVQTFQVEKMAAAEAEKDMLTIAPPKNSNPHAGAWEDTDTKFIKVNTGEWRYRRPELDKAACRLCGWCNVYCPTGCMQKWESDGYYHPNLTYCKGCGICAVQCPAKAIQMKAEEVI